jgi:cathepsin A (carboxypeptidase C)
MTQKYEVCQKMIKAQKYDEAYYYCGDIQAIATGPGPKFNFNLYDIRLPCEVEGLCYDFSLASKFIERKDVREALGVGDRKWSMCSDKVGSFFISDQIVNVGQKVAYLVDNNIRTLVYSGDKDFSCNWEGG